MEDDTDIAEMFAALGPVSIRRMFGGKGIYRLGRIVAIALHDEIMLKADAISAPQFEAAGARRWTHEGKAGKAVAMPYWSIPEDAFDDPSVMADWVRLAYAAALRVSPDTPPGEVPPVKPERTRRRRRM